MGTIKRFEDLEVWQKARLFAKAVYEKTNHGSFSRDFGLRDQINRSTGSVMDNIAEGFERDGRQEFVQFLSIAKSSAGKARSQLYRAYDRQHLGKEDLDTLVDDALSLGNAWGFHELFKKIRPKGFKIQRS